MRSAISAKLHENSWRYVVTYSVKFGEPRNLGCATDEKEPQEMVANSRANRGFVKLR